MLNQKITEIFYKIADILEMQNVEWKPRAYRRAAKGIETLTEDITDVYKKGGIRALKEIPGVGTKLGEKIEEFIKTGRVREFERLSKTIPKHLNELMDVPGLGARKAKILYQKLGIRTILQLKKAVEKHKICKLAAFKEKSEQNILEGIKFIKSGGERKLLSTVLLIALKIEANLKRFGKVRIAGSLRRRKETIKDIDILVASKMPKDVVDFFSKMPEVKRVLALGPTKSTVILENNIQADIRVVNEECFGSALLYFTGSKEHNIALRELAIKKGYKLNEYGLFKGTKRIAGLTEEKVYRALGLKYIEPELRENLGEIEAARMNKLPKLISIKDIKGDIHVHTKWSDGNNSIEEMALVAKKLGYEYICITDHSKTRAIAHGLKENQLLKQIHEIKRLNRRIKGIRILTGSEVDILADGTLDYSDDILKKLDVVIAAVHSGFKMPKEKMTTRIIKALENEHVDIIDHPTGRIINTRPPYQVDLDKIFKRAKELGKFIEINAFPDRLDLRDVDIKRAIDAGVKLTIGTDAHDVNHLRYMAFGVATARRGWAEKKDILNCLSLKEFLNVFKS